MIHNSGKFLKPEKGQRNLRRFRTSAPGDYYFITICVEGKESILIDNGVVAQSPMMATWNPLAKPFCKTEMGNKDITDNGIRDIIFGSLDFLDEKGRISLICCVIMPDHLHMVFRLMEENELSEVMRSFKLFTARRINGILSRNGEFWQEQYYEHKIRAEEDLWSIARYCQENPLRKGLVDDPEKYPFWKFHPENIDR